MTENTSIASRIRHTVNISGMSITEAAKRCGMAQPNMSRAMSNRARGPRMTTLHKIAKGLGVSFDWLLYGGHGSNISMDNHAIITLPWPPSVNGYWRTFRGRQIISSDGRKYRAKVCALLVGVQPMTGPLRVELVAHPPDRRRRDLDNLLKSPLDALTHAGVYGDDSQIRHLTIRWATVEDAAADEGALVVRIEKMQEF